MMTSMEVELREMVQEALKEGYTKAYIEKQFIKVLNIIRDPEPELKGDMDT